MWAKPSAGPERLKVASKLPDGAHFYRCALQVNPFAYLGRQNKSTSLQDEATYNAAIIAACLDQDIKVIGVTDHYRVDGSAGLVKTAREAGLFAFSGFEAVAKDGLHILCLFNQDKDSILERYIGQCGIHSLDDASPIGTLDCLELLSHAKELGGGLHCGSCRRRWRRPAEKAVRSDPNKCLESPGLLACALPGPVSDAPQNLKSILENKDASHSRDRPVAIINAPDVNSPDDLRKPGASCLIKMSEISVEGLRQAFLDPVSRVRLNTEAPAESHAEFVAMSWEGGFLRETLFISTRIRMCWSAGGVPANPR